VPLTPSGGDILLHLIDVDITNAEYSQLSKWFEFGYLQDAISSGLGGNYEGLGRVLTASSGVGMLASSYNIPLSDTKSSSSSSSHTVAAASDSTVRPNVWAPVGETDEANLPRNISPLAGSFSLHYNLTHIVSHPDGILSGGEVLVDLDGWHTRQALGKHLHEEQQVIDSEITRLNNEELFQEGLCMDNLHYELSTHGYGRGGFASRFLTKGSIVAPVPVLPIPRQELRYLRANEWKKVIVYRRKLRDGSEQSTQSEEEIQEMLPPNIEWRQQLLLNYCFGHQHSSVLLFPYGHANYVNHAPSHNLVYAEHDNGPVANVRLRWSERLIQKEEGGTDPRSLSPSNLMQRRSPEGLVLEMVALRDITPGEEILLDYGSAWHLEWTRYVERWNDHKVDKPAVVDEYSPAYIMEDVVSNLRTAEEELQFPYPDNVFTACFYRYVQSEDDGMVDKQVTSLSPKAKERTEAIPWKMSAGLFEMTNLRPCKVIAREPIIDRYAPQMQQQQQQQPGKGNMFYTAIIQNRPGLPPNERIPKGQKLIVSGIPRGAVRFVDRPYTSDVHLEGAFRHHIGLEEAGIYPEIWLDMA
jgi:hypothetical protein